MTNDLKRILSRAGNIPAFAIFRSWFVIYTTFFPVLLTSRFSPFFSAAPLPLFDGGLFHSPVFCVLIKLIFFISVPILISGRWVEYSGILAGFSFLLLNFLYPNEIFAFDYYAPLAFVAFAFTEAATKKGKRAFPPETLLAFFVSSVYLSASLQKLTHFDLTMKWLPFEVLSWARPQFLAICPSGDCLLLELATKTVIPIELAIGLLFLFRPTRLWGLLFAFCFHTVMYTATPLRPIGIMLFTIQSSLALLASGWPIKKLFGDRRILQGLLFLLPLGISIGILQFFSSHETAFALEFVRTIVCFWPFLVIGFFAFRDQKREVQKTTATFTNVFQSRSLFFVLFLVAYSLFPTVEGYRQTRILGWAMFSGAYFQNPYYFVTVKSEHCEMWNFAPLVIKKSLSRDDTRYSSLDENYLQRYLSKLREKCPDAQISAVGIRYLSRE